MNSVTVERSVLVVDQGTADEAREFRSDLQSVGASIETVSVSAGGRQINVPKALAKVLDSLIDAMSRNATVTIGMLPEVLTTSEAARQLGVSRPTVMRMVRDNEIPAHKVGSHTRLYTRDVLAAAKKRHVEERGAFDELRDFEESLGLAGD